MVVSTDTRNMSVDTMEVSTDTWEVSAYMRDLSADTREVSAGGGVLMKGGVGCWLVLQVLHTWLRFCRMGVRGEGVLVKCAFFC